MAKNAPKKSAKKAPKKSADNSAAIRGVLNLVFAILIGIGAWFAAPSVVRFLAANVPNFNTLPLQGQGLNIAIAVLLFVLGVMLSASVLAVVLPGDTRAAKDTDIKKQQDERFAARRKATGSRVKKR
jgi:hypothetical protein